MKMVTMSSVIGKNAKWFMVLMLVGANLLGSNNIAAAGEQKSDKPDKSAVIQKTVKHHKHKDASHKKGAVLHKKAIHHPRTAGRVEHAIATIYGGPRWNGNSVACERPLKKAGHKELAKFNDARLTAASNTWSCGAIVLVKNLSTEKVVEVTITDTGKLGRGVIDLSTAAATQLGITAKAGTAHVTVVGIADLIEES